MPPQTRLSAQVSLISDHDLNSFVPSATSSSTSRGGSSSSEPRKCATCSAKTCKAVEYERKRVPNSSVEQCCGVRPLETRGVKENQQTGVVARKGEVDVGNPSPTSLPSFQFPNVEHSVINKLFSRRQEIGSPPRRKGWVYSRRGILSDRIAGISEA